MNRKHKMVAAGVLASGVVTATGVTLAVGAGDDDERPITGTELERASAAALEHTGGGRVTGTEVGDEDSYYEVEVTLADGSQVDVQLDRQFGVVGSEVDAEDDENGSDESGDD